MTTVADRIAWILAEKGWSARELAALARREGISDAAIECVLAEPVTAERALRSPAWWLATMRLREVELHERALTEPAPRPPRSRKGNPVPSTAPGRSGGRR